MPGSETHKVIIFSKMLIWKTKIFHKLNSKGSFEKLGSSRSQKWPKICSEEFISQSNFEFKITFDLKQPLELNLGIILVFKSIFKIYSSFVIAFLTYLSIIQYENIQYFRYFWVVIAEKKGWNIKCPNVSVSYR